MYHTSTQIPSATERNFGTDQSDFGHVKKDEAATTNLQIWEMRRNLGQVLGSPYMEVIVATLL